MHLRVLSTERQAEMKCCPVRLVKCAQQSIPQRSFLVMSSLPSCHCHIQTTVQMRMLPYIEARVNRDRCMYAVASLPASSRLSSSVERTRMAVSSYCLSTPNMSASLNSVNSSPSSLMALPPYSGSSTLSPSFTLGAITFPSLSRPPLPTLTTTPWFSLD